MRTTIDGTRCDTARGRIELPTPRQTLIARHEHLPELYRTILGRFFVREEADGGFETAKLLRKTEAMQLYESLPDKRLEFDDAFED